MADSHTTTSLTYVLRSLGVNELVQKDMYFELFNQKSLKQSQAEVVCESAIIKAQTVPDAKPCPESADTTYLMRKQSK